MNTLFSPTVLPDEKKRILSEKYNIAMTTELESEVQRMCNLGTAIESKARDEGRVEGRAEGRNEGVDPEKSACPRQKSINSIKVI
ncbi:hypothetical protein LIZ53_15275 [Lachnoclostridium sp. 210928-DFI.6.3]|nr:hypothetical protein [Lachnoclostridium sp. 210928-DFI.6.3]